MKSVLFEVIGGTIRVDAAEDISVMRLAKNNAVPGIDGDCGGEMVCGTCHVLVDATTLAILPPPDEMEEMILECVPDPHPNARLSCQLRARDCPNGSRFVVPNAQR